MTTRDDDLLAVLGRAGREGLDVPADRRWDALAEGDLSPDDRAALEALAKLSEEGREAFEAFRPIDEAARAETAARVLASLASQRGGAAPRPSEGAARAPLPRRRARWAALAAALAAAAVIAVVVRSSAPAPLPGYAMTVVGERDERGAPGVEDRPVRLGPGARLRIVLRPDHRVEGPIAARGFIAREGRWSAWSAPTEVARDGVVLIAGAREDLFPGARAGLFTIAIAVGREAALPADPDAVTRGDAVRVMRARVELHDDGGP